MNRIPSIGRWCLIASLVVSITTLGDAAQLMARKGGMRTRSSQRRTTFSYVAQHGACSGKRVWEHPTQSQTAHRQDTLDEFEDSSETQTRTSHFLFLADATPPYDAGTLSAGVFPEVHSPRSLTLHALRVRLNL